MMMRRLERARRDRLEGNLTEVIVEANLKMIEHSRAAEKIEPDTESLGETDRSAN
jgi:hypothetical protein